MLMSKNKKTKYTRMTSSTRNARQQIPFEAHHRPPLPRQQNLSRSLFHTDNRIEDSKATALGFPSQQPDLLPNHKAIHYEGYDQEAPYFSQPLEFQDNNKMNPFHPACNHSDNKFASRQELKISCPTQAFKLEPGIDAGCAFSSNKPYVETGCIVDHTYRDFSKVPPSREDLERYSNNKIEYDRRIKEKRETIKDRMQDTKSPPMKAPKHLLDKKSKLNLKKNGRGNKCNAGDGNDSFIGFMGTNFPARLHDLLSHEEDISDIITWLPHGRSWIVRNKREFLEKVAPSHFQISKFESFTRQVNGWGFKRITQGPDMNSYYHELFLRGMPHLIQWMKRVAPSKQAGRRRIRADPKDEPNFYDIGSVYPIPDYYKEKKIDSRVTAMPEPALSAQAPMERPQSTPAYENHTVSRGHSGRARNESKLHPSEFQDSKRDLVGDLQKFRMNVPEWQYENTTCHEDTTIQGNRNFLNPRARPSPPTQERTSANSSENLVNSENSRKTSSSDIDDFWSYASYDNSQQQYHHIVPDFEDGRRKDMRSSGDDQTLSSLMNYSSADGVEPMATKQHWKCFYDALADDDNNHNTPHHHADFDADADFIHEISPVPIECFSHYHSLGGDTSWNSGEGPKAQSMKMIEFGESAGDGQHSFLEAATYECHEPSVITFV